MKQIFDITIVLIAAVIWLPVAAIAATAVALTLGRPILFTQERPGLKGKIFKLYKFRTMADRWNHTGRLLPDEERMTMVGNLLRKLSIDEIPQLFNVLKGDISLVGPRPLLIEYMPLYNADQARRHDVKPGITGWAQVNGRNAISWEEKFALDCWYVDHRSFWLDIKILWLTLIKVFRMEGINREGYTTMPPFVRSSKVN